MAKQYSSTLSTDQLIQLAHHIFKPNSQDIRYVGALMRAHTIGSTPHWNRQELIAFITDRNGGVEPDQLLKNMQERAANAAKPTHALPTSETIDQKTGKRLPREAPKRRVAVFVPCFACGKDVAVPEDKADSRIWCDQK